MIGELAPLPASISAADAAAQGFHILAGPYKESERWMLDNAVADLRRARRDFAIVRIGYSRSLEIWVNGHVSFLSPE